MTFKEETRIKFKKMLCIVMALVIVVGGISASPIFAVDKNYGKTTFEDKLLTADNYDDYKIDQYNAIIRNDLTVDSADVEGAIAVGNDIIVEGSYSIGAAHSGANGQHTGDVFNEYGPAVLHGGDLIDPEHQMVVDGDVVTYDASQYDDNNVYNYLTETRNVVEDDQENILNLFHKCYTIVMNYISNLDIYTPTDKVEGGGYISANDDEYGVSYFYNTNQDNVIVAAPPTKDGVAVIDEVYIPKQENLDKFLIIYSKADVVNFTQGATIYDGNVVLDPNIPMWIDDNDEVKSIAGRILYVFPNATEVNILQTGVLGSVVAPNADLYGDGGSINGQVYVYNSEQVNGFEFHNYYPIWRDKITDETGTIEVVKLDEETHKKLPSAEFTLYDTDGNFVARGVTDENGFLKFTNIPYGDYILIETISPPGYEQILDEIPVTIDENHKVVQFEIENIKSKGTLELTKENTNGETLEGAEFELYYVDEEEGITNGVYSDVVMDGDEVEKYVANPLGDNKTYVSNSDGKIYIENLELGNYILVETKAPDNYIEFEVGKPIAISAKNPNVVETIVNEEIPKGSLVIYKENEDEEALEGAEFKIYKMEDDGTREFIGTFTTDKDGVIQVDDLEMGTYLIVETKAPDGYIIDSLNNSYTVVIDENGQQVVETTVVNKAVDESLVKLYKEDENGNRLEGAVFSVSSVTSDSAIKIGEYTTDENGIIYIKGLENGDYIITEEESPNGYINDGFEEEFTITDDNKEFSFTVENKLDQTGSATIKKEDEKGNTLEGAEFKVSAVTSGGALEVVGKYTTDEDGIIVIDDLPLGNYVLTEIKAPSGYILDDTKIKFEITDEDLEYTYTAINEEILGSIELMKVDEDDNSVKLEGAVFELYNINGDMIGEPKTTDENGMVIWEDLPLGRYRLYETKAPDGYDIPYKNYVDVEVYESSTEIHFTAKNKKSEPEVPIKPTEPVDPSEPTNPTDPSEPEESTEPEDPSEPKEPLEPSEPTESIEPSEPTESIEPSEPTESTEPEIVAPVETQEPDSSEAVDLIETEEVATQTEDSLIGIDGEVPSSIDNLVGIDGDVPGGINYADSKNPQTSDMGYIKNILFIGFLGLGIILFRKKKKYNLSK